MAKIKHAATIDRGQFARLIKITRATSRYADRQERPGPFIAPVAGSGVGCFVGEIGRNQQSQPTAELKPKVGAGLK